MARLAQLEQSEDREEGQEGRCPQAFGTKHGEAAQGQQRKGEGPKLS